MKRVSLLIALCFFVITNAGAQELYNSSGARITRTAKKKSEPKGFDPQRVIFGGGLGLSFGQVTQIGLAPVLGYRITDNFAAGIGVGYQYLRVKDFIPLTDLNGITNYYDYKASILYPSVWARYVVYNNFFLQAEFEHDFQTYTDYRYDQNGSGAIESYKLKYDNNALLLGAGFRQPVTDNSSFIILAMYDLIQDEFSPYRNRLDFRFGFNVGF